MTLGFIIDDMNLWNIVFLFEIILKLTINMENYSHIKRRLI
jgi:hypothetical protein